MVRYRNYFKQKCPTFYKLLQLEHSTFTLQKAPNFPCIVDLLEDLLKAMGSSPMWLTNVHTHVD
jgi:hypothetical protein